MRRDRAISARAGQRDVGSDGVQLRAQVRPEAVHRAGTFQLGGGGRRVAGGERGADEEEQELDPAARLGEPGQQGVADRARRSGFPGVGEDGHEHLVGVGVGRDRGAGRGELPGALGRQLRAGQGTAGQRAPRVLGGRRRRRLPVARRRARSAAGSHQGPGRPRMGPVHRDERPARQLLVFGRQELREHRLAGESVAEPEPLAVDDELRVDRLTQRRDRRRAVHSCNTG